MTSAYFFEQNQTVLLFIKISSVIKSSLCIVMKRINIFAGTDTYCISQIPHYAKNMIFCLIGSSQYFTEFNQSFLLLLIKHTGTAKPSGSSTGVNGVILAEAPTGWAPLNRPPSEEVAMDSAETEGILITFLHFIIFCSELSIESYSNLIDNHVFYTPAF